MRTFLIILLGILSLLFPRSGKAHDFYFRHYTNKQGLSHNTVYCALQDKKGFMWFGTDDGLNRFDGHQFRIYRFSRNTIALPTYRSSKNCICIKILHIHLPNICISHINHRFI